MSRIGRLRDLMPAQFLTFLTGRIVGVVASKLIDAIHRDGRLVGKQSTCVRAHTEVGEAGVC